MGENTTIAIAMDTKKCLDELKIIKQEPYDMVIKRILRDLLDNCEEGFDKETKKLIEERINEVNCGKVLSTKDLKQKLFTRD